MPRSLAIFLTATFLIAPFSVFADEQPTPISPEVPSQNIPIYLYISSHNTILGISPITPNLFAGCEATLPDPSNPENTQETPQIPDCFLLVPNQNKSSTTENTGEGVAQSAQLVQTLDYYPFGSIRVNKLRADGLDEKRKFTGYEHDYSTGLNYAGARYQNPSQGRFVSQDPVFLELGTQIDAQRLEKYLTDPQGLNAYAYVKNNPLRLVDPNGEWFKELLTFRQSPRDFQVELGEATQQLTQDSKVWNYAVSNPKKAGAVVGIASGAIALPGVNTVAALKSSVVIVNGVGKVLVVNRLIEGGLYGLVTSESIREFPKWLENASEIKRNDLRSVFNFATQTALEFGPNALGETVDAAADIIKTEVSLMKRALEKDED